MTASLVSADRADGARWTASLLLILALHAAAVVLIARRVDLATFAPSAEPFMIELAPEPAAPASAPVPSAPAASPALATPVSPEEAIVPTPESTPPAPPDAAAAQQSEATPVAPPQAAVELPQPEPLPVLPPPVAMPAPTPLRPNAPRPPPRPARSPASRPAPSPTAAHRAEPQAPSPVTVLNTPAPTTAAPSLPDPQAAASWRSLLLGRLQAAKRYPERARSRGDQGVALTTFTLDRAGHVLSASLARSSGSTLLDEEAVALIHRAEPLPPPPPNVQGSTLTLAVPVSFALR